ncbi:hypothetical protein EAI_07956 [Harpegnathos saltator]|uniref:Uncharacterized protein n=1 Tax=Harpegnathos saltator TaxID=610380 RepID=E2BXQ5_HARSA|nr:hypothetical protein EAI_07956 [Harpegnathos saltator]
MTTEARSYAVLSRQKRIRSNKSVATETEAASSEITEDAVRGVTGYVKEVRAMREERLRLLEQLQERTAQQQQDTTDFVSNFFVI